MSDWFKDINDQDAREEALNEREKKFKKKRRKFKRDQLQKQIDDLKQEMKIANLHYNVLHDRTINDHTIEKAEMKALAVRLAFLYEVKTLIKDAATQALIERITHKFEMYQTLRLEEKRSLLEDVRQLGEKMGLTTEKLEFRNEMNEKMHQMNIDYQTKKLELMEKEHRFFETEVKTLSRNEVILLEIKYLIQIHLMDVGHKMDQVQMFLQVDKASRTVEGQKLLHDVEIKRLNMDNALKGVQNTRDIVALERYYELANEYNDVSQELTLAESLPDNDGNIQFIRGILRDIGIKRDRFYNSIQEVISERKGVLGILHQKRNYIMPRETGVKVFTIRTCHLDGIIMKTYLSTVRNIFKLNHLSSWSIMQLKHLLIQYAMTMILLMSEIR